jgi:hypothetical protein
MMTPYLQTRCSTPRPTLPFHNDFYAFTQIVGECVWFSSLTSRLCSLLLAECVDFVAHEESDAAAVREHWADAEGQQQASNVFGELEEVVSQSLASNRGDQVGLIRQSIGQASVVRLNKSAEVANQRSLRPSASECRVVSALGIGHSDFPEGRGRFPSARPYYTGRISWRMKTT